MPPTQELCGLGADRAGGRASGDSARPPGWRDHDLNREEAVEPMSQAECSTGDPGVGG